MFGLISAQTQPQAGGGIDIMTILLFAMLGVFVFMMFRAQQRPNSSRLSSSRSLPRVSRS